MSCSEANIALGFARREPAAQVRSSGSKMFLTAMYQSVSMGIDYLMFDYRRTGLYCIAVLSYADCPIPRAIPRR